MAREIPVTQARADLAELVNRVAYSGERILLTRHGKPLAALVPAAELADLEPAPEKIGFTRGVEQNDPQQAPAHRGQFRIAAEARPDGTIGYRPPNGG